MNSRRNNYSNYISRILSAKAFVPGVAGVWFTGSSFQFLIPLGGAEHPCIRFFSSSDL